MVDVNGTIDVLVRAARPWRNASARRRNLAASQSRAACRSCAPLSVERSVGLCRDRCDPRRRSIRVRRDGDTAMICAASVAVRAVVGVER